MDDLKEMEVTEESSLIEQEKRRKKFKTHLDIIAPTLAAMLQKAFNDINEVLPIDKIEFNEMEDGGKFILRVTGAPVNNVAFMGAINRNNDVSFHLDQFRKSSVWNKKMKLDLFFPTCMFGRVRMLLRDFDILRLAVENLMNGLVLGLSFLEESCYRMEIHSQIKYITLHYKDLHMVDSISFEDWTVFIEE